MLKISSMANGVVMPPCSLSSLPRMYPRTRNDPTSTPFRQLQLSQSRSLGFCFRLSDGFKEKSWAARVGAPLSDATFHDDGDEVDTSGANPKHCWVKNPWKSMSYVVRDVAVVAGLVSLAVNFDCWAAWLFHWCAQSIMLWDLFVLAHDSFHAWRTSHQKIQNHRNVENDNPLNEKTQILRFFFPIHLWSSSPGKMGSHYDPNSELFLPNERTACWITMVVLLVPLSFVIGPILMLKLYGAPYVGFVVCLDLVYYLLISYISSNPTLQLNRSTAAEPVIAKYYREPKKSVPLALHLLGVLVKSFKIDHYVRDTGDIVYYQTDEKLSGSLDLGHEVVKFAGCYHIKRRGSWRT